MRRLVLAFAGRKYHIAGNPVSRLNYVFLFILNLVVLPEKKQDKSLKNKIGCG